MGHYRILIDRNVCLGLGLCAEVDPELFTLDAAGKATAPDEVEASLSKLLDAAEGCPVQAITIADRTTGERIYPG